MTRDEELLKISHEKAEFHAGVQWAVEKLRSIDAEYEESNGWMQVCIWADWLEHQFSEINK